MTLGANHMRSRANLPEHVKLFPQYLREAGYYCTNNSKTDYNLNWNQKLTWDDSSGKAHWKNRPASDKPFFSVFNLTMTHESKIWPSGWNGVVKNLPQSQRHRPEEMIVPPLYPDTPAVRADIARLADIITVMDLEVGSLLKELEDAGLAENTVVIFWSDHGDGLPRAKRWTYESGSHVPLIVRVPEKFRSLAGSAEPGSKDDRLINLIDLGPTVLSLAGLPQAEYFHGIPFLGPAKGEESQFIYGARDRLDERFDMVRTVRSRTHRYVRNLMPWRPALQHVAYGEQNETLREMRRLLGQNELDPSSAQWFSVPRPAEELYDITSDPWELNNLADDPAHQATLTALRTECDDWQIRVRDAHLLPEIMLDEAEQQLGNRWQILHGPDGELRTRSLLEAAKMTSHLDENTANELSSKLSEDPAIRWWQLSLISHATHAQLRNETLSREASSQFPALQIAAAGLARSGQAEAAAATLRPLLANPNQFVRHAAMLEIDEAGPNVITLLRDTLSAGNNEEYVRRLMEHAEDQL